MPSPIEIIRDFRFSIDPRKVLHRVGEKRALERVDEGLKRSLAEEQDRLTALLRPGSIFRFFDYEETNRHPIFNGARKVALAVCTAGIEVEKEVSRLCENQEVLRGLLLDALGTEAVKEIFLATEKRIVERSFALGLWPSKRFSPGYKGWDIREQRFVFSRLPAEKIGVRLTASCMMVPRKSLSFRINLYPERAMTTRKFIV